MRIGLVPWKNAALRWRHGSAGRAALLAGALLLALGLSLAAGSGQARAAALTPSMTGGLFFSAPNYQGVIGGPPGARTTLQGGSWLPYSQVTLSLTPQAGNCDGAVAVGTYPTDPSGAFTVSFLWPAAANQIGAYYACGTQDNNGTAISGNVFNVLSSSPAALSFSPASVIAGDVITLSGSNWLPGPQTINILIVPCSTLCQKPAAAYLQVVTGSDGTFSQQVTISAGAASAGYYAQATNAKVTLSAIAGPIQVTGQGSATGTPLPGTDPTTSATRTTQKQTPPAAAPVSASSTALWFALVAGGVGLLVLLGLIGLIVFMVTRSRRGAELPLYPKGEQPADSLDLDVLLAEVDQSGRWGKSIPMGPARQPPALPHAPAGRRGFHGPPAEEEREPGGVPPSVILAPGKLYPWAQQADPSLPGTSSPAADSDEPLPTEYDAQRTPRRPGVPPGPPSPDEAGE